MPAMKKIHWFVNIHNDIFKLRRSVATILVFAFCLFQLGGCGVVDKHFATYDGAPRVDVDASKVHDAVPKVEPLHPYGTKDYKVAGRHYHVLKNAKGYVKRGKISWYGSKFHGKATSTQETFNLYAMTAASPELPLPSYVQVTNLSNGKKVVVRVNDRGPFCANRILDLSYVAAKKLGFAESGVAHAEVKAIDPKTWGKNGDAKTLYAENKSKGESLSSKSKQANESRVFLQLGAFAKLDNAKMLLDKATQFINKPVHIEHKSDLYRVQIGPLASSSQGDKLKLFLEQKGFKNVTVIDG